MTTVASESWATRRGRVGGLSRWSLALLLVLGSLLAVVSPAAAAQGATPTAAQGPAPATAAAVPETAVMYFSLNLDRTSDQWQKAEELLARVGVPNAIDELERGLMEEGQPSSDFSEADLNALLGGEMAVVVTKEAVSRFMQMAMAPGGTDSAAALATPAPGDGHGIAGVLLPGDPDAAWSYVERQFDHLAQDEGAQVERSTYAGQTILSVAATDESSPGIASARVDDFILAGEVPSDLEPLIDTATGASPSLAGFGPLSDVRAELAGDSLLFGFINGEAMLDAVGPEVVAGLEQMTPAGMGAGAYQGYSGLVLWADDPGFRLDSITIPAAGSNFDQLIPATTDVTSDEQVPADSLIFFGGNLPEGTWSGLALSAAQTINLAFAEAQGRPVATPTTIEEQFSPQYIEEQIAAANRIVGFDLRADLFDQLTGELTLALSAPNLMAGGTDVNGILAIGVADTDTVCGSVDRVVRLIEQSAGGAADVSTRQVDGDEIHVIRDPQNPMMPAIEFGLVGDQLLAGTGDGIDDFVNGPAASLADDEQYQRVLATLPTDYYQVSYVNLAQVIPLAMMAGGMRGEMGGDEMGGMATPEASPAAGSPTAIQALAAVTFARDGKIGQSSILYIAEPGS